MALDGDQAPNQKVRDSILGNTKILQKSNLQLLEQ